MALVSRPSRQQWLEGAPPPRQNRLILAEDRVGRKRVSRRVSELGVRKTYVAGSAIVILTEIASGPRSPRPRV